MHHKSKRESLYDATVRFLPIGEVMNRLVLQTQVDLGDEKFVVDPVEFYSVFIPHDIPDGRKHKRYRAMTEILVHLNPDADLLTIQSFISFVNDNILSRSMSRQRLLDIVSHAYAQVKLTGEMHVRPRVKTVHTRKGHGKLAPRIVGCVKLLMSVDKIQRSKETIIADGKKVTKTSVAGRSGLCWKTVSRYWGTSVEEVFEEMEDLKK